MKHQPSERLLRQRVLDKSNPDHVAFDYIKSTLFRVAHVDGVIGSGTPSGLLHIACYSERPAIPRRMVFDLTSDGRMGDEVTSLKETRDSIVRELEVDLIMTVQVASSLRDWLGLQIENIQRLQNMSELGEEK